MQGATINKKSRSVSANKGAFDAQAFLDSAGIARRVKAFKESGNGLQSR